MAESIIVTETTDRKTLYRELYPQLESLTLNETDLIANLANIVGALRQTFQFFWVGVYFVKGEELVLGPFQGPVACTRISFGKGVCGSSWKRKETILVPDVEKFPGHIACSSESKSEIVIPALDDSENVFLVLDVDSDRLDDFSETDQIELENIARLIEKLWNKQPSSV
ncbi:GAF domain-containing protein [Leptospira saintgironsiae]|uniref:GAF domain-containing protein n=1 Tax=Leptospira saintgironsiae TaxID=2023183 RepID=A0A2M9YHI8_9LEPT|nr:GAF domain-containing protein [Leptospira saintgironsiae]PJZ50980.1 GAF domain-containing protein [Leptospira saintgironsiae]